MKNKGSTGCEEGVENKESAESKRDIRREKEKSAGEGTNEAIEDEAEQRKRWQSWLEEDWYREVVWFRLFGLTEEEKGSHQLASRIRWKAASFHLTARRDGSPSLIFVERNGSRSWCVRPAQVQTVLLHYHDGHGHFATTVTQRRLIGAYYWPTRM